MTLAEKKEFNETFRNEKGELLTYSTVDTAPPYNYTAVTEAVCGNIGNGIAYMITKDGTLWIHGNGAMPDLSANQTPWNGYSDEITKLVIGEGILSVGRCAFYGLSALKNVTLPQSLTVIDEYGFYGCSSLTAVTLPKNLYYIGAYAFRRTAMTSIESDTDGWTVNGSTTALEPTALTKTEYKKPFMRTPRESGTVIAEGRFGKTNALYWKLTDTGLLTISGEGKMPTFSSNGAPWSEYRSVIRAVKVEDGVTSVGRCALHTSRPLTEISLPNSLTEIQEYAFYNCINLKTVTVPENTVSIGKFAFRKCRSLIGIAFEIPYGWYADGEKLTATDVTVSGADMLTLSHYKYNWTRDVNAENENVDPLLVDGGSCNTRIIWRLRYTDENKTEMKLTVSGTGAIPNYNTAAAPWYGYSESITEIEVTEGVTAIGRCAFYGLKKVTAVTLPEGLTEIGDYAFNTCKSLSGITVPKTVTYISPTAFGKTNVII